MAETFTPFDAADYLRDEADIVAYLEAASEEGDAPGLVMALGTVARARARLAGRSGDRTEALEADADEMLSPLGNPTLAAVMKAADALGFAVVIRPKAAGPHSAAE